MKVERNHETWCFEYQCVRDSDYQIVFDSKEELKEYSKFFYYHAYINGVLYVNICQEHFNRFLREYEGPFDKIMWGLI